MLNLSRLRRVEEALRAQGVDQMIVTDPVAIFYLTGRWFHPGERFLGLVLRAGETPVLFLNELFRFDGDIGTEIRYLTDTTDLPEALRPALCADAPLGIDKRMTAGHLLQLIGAGLAASYVNTSPALDAVRAVKDAAEIETMREASRINDRAMARFKTLIRPGVTEAEVAAQIPGIYRELGASGCSFDPIIAFGRNSADPHHEPDDTVVQPGDTVLFDVGCVYENYCSDMTRTFFYQKAPEGEAKRIYELVRSANEAAEAILRPGLPLCEADAAARGLIAAAGYGPDFTHRLGHFIGIEVHDFGDVSAANRAPMQTGNFFSIEPGIYRPDIVGVRIEDLVHITEDGAEVLNHYPKDIEVIG